MVFELYFWLLFWAQLAVATESETETETERKIINHGYSSESYQLRPIIHDDTHDSVCENDTLLSISLPALVLLLLGVKYLETRHGIRVASFSFFFIFFIFLLFPEFFPNLSV